MKNKIKLISVITLTVIIAFSMAACKSAEEKAQEALQGTWKNKEVDMEMTFKDKNVTWKASGELFVEGTFTAKEGLLTITPTKPDSMKGTPLLFTYNISGNNLTFTSNTLNGIIFTK